MYGIDLYTRSVSVVVAGFCSDRFVITSSFWCGEVLIVIFGRSSDVVAGWFDIWGTSSKRVGVLWGWLSG